LLPAADIVDWFTSEVDHLPSVLSVAAVLGLALLLPLYRAQRRDVLRLRAFMDAEPDYPARDLAASEATLDETEAELERLGVSTVSETAVMEPGTTPAEPVPAATRVTSERPALTRITMERAALAPHPRWRRFVARVTQPRVLISIAAAALLLGAGAIFVTERLLSDEDGEQPRAGKIDKASVDVAVLNGTAITGLGGKVQAVVEENGYAIAGPTSTTTPGFKRTEVLYEPHNKAAAQKVAKDLGVDPDEVRLLDRQTRRQVSTDAEVVVIAGEDKAKS
jgi:hypothetical protein